MALKSIVLVIENVRRSERGNAYIEYFVIASVVTLAALAFYNQGKFRGARASVEQAVDSMITRIVSP